MKTLADFKRALTLGSSWEAYHNGFGKSFGIRKVGLVQSNCVGFMNPETNVNSYLYFPKASEFKINSLGQAEIYCEGRLLLTYTKIDN